MTRSMDARCANCGSIFPRERAETGPGGGLECPVCGGSVVQGIPDAAADLGTAVNTRCTACGSTFSRRRAITETKGVLACPVCGSTSDLEVIEK